jgi:hypothetical protein
MRCPIALPNDHGIEGVGGHPGQENMEAVPALDTPADVFGPDPHVGSLAVGAGNTDVTSHVLSVSRIIESGNAKRIGAAAR